MACEFFADLFQTKSQCSWHTERHFTRLEESEFLRCIEPLSSSVLFRWFELQDRRTWFCRK